ncbi:MAG: hypothetical protein EOP50_09835, partial [Sphingobacteriales bacterium]
MKKRIDSELHVKVAIFDVDGTLIADNIGITFVKYLNARSAIRPIPKIAVLLGYLLYKSKLVGFKTAIRLGYFAIAGLEVSKVRELASQCFTEIIKDKVFADGIAE